MEHMHGRRDADAKHGGRHGGRLWSKARFAKGAGGGVVPTWISLTQIRMLLAVHSSIIVFLGSKTSHNENAKLSYT